MEAIVEKRLRKIQELTQRVTEKEKKVEDLEKAEQSKKTLAKEKLTKEIMKALKILGPASKYIGAPQKTVIFGGNPVELDPPINFDAIYLGCLPNSNRENLEYVAYLFLSDTRIHVYTYSLKEGNPHKKPYLEWDILLTNLDPEKEKKEEITILATNVRSMEKLEALWSNIKRLTEEAERTIEERGKRLDLRLRELLKTS